MKNLTLKMIEKLGAKDKVTRLSLQATRKINNEIAEVLIEVNEDYRIKSAASEKHVNKMYLSPLPETNYSNK